VAGNERSPGKGESDENKRWFVNRVDSVIQNLIDVQRSDYDSFSSQLRESDDAILKTRNVVWQAIAAIAAASITLTQLGVLKTAYLFDIIALLIAVAVGWTIVIAVVRDTLLPKMEKVDEAYDSTSLSLLSLQGWFRNSTMSVSETSQDTLDLYYEFGRVAVAAQNSTLLSNLVKFQDELRFLRIIKRGKKHQPSWQRLSPSIEEGYARFKRERTKLTDPAVFPANLLSILAPFEERYKAEEAGGIDEKPAFAISINSQRGASGHQIV
jgi:hypothetical protein